MSRMRHIFGSLLCGVVGAYALTPYGLWPLMFVSLSGFYFFYAQAQAPSRAVLTGFMYGLGYFTAGLWWIGNALLIDGNDFWWVWPLAVIGLPVLLSFFTAIFTGMAYVLSNPRHFSGLICLTGALGLSEWVRGHIFTGFPWNLFGYIWADTLAVAQISAWIGSYGLTLFTLLWGCTAGFLYVSVHARRHQYLILMGIVLTFLIPVSAGAWRLYQHPTQYDDAYQVHIVQPNIGQDMKWDSARAVAHFEKHLRLSASSNQSPATRLIIWPETAIPSVFLIDPGARRLIRDMLSQHNSKAFLISGILDRRQNSDTGKTLYYNGVAIFDAQGQMTPVYSKTHLVPFGEFIPFQEWIPLKPVVAFSGFEKGSGSTSVAMAGIPVFSPLVCYEIIFPSEAITRHPLPPRWIVNVTNDAWYGKSAGPPQHFAHSVFRSIENGVPVVRSANTGISGMTDPVGRVLAKTKLDTEDTLILPLPAPLSTLPLYTSIKDAGFLILAILFLLFPRCMRALQNQVKKKT